MRAFAVFAGGGVKGAALAGALAAARDNGIEFQGYVGASAGSIVALLASLGFSNDELSTILVEKKFSELLDDDGYFLDKLKAKLKVARSSKVFSLYHLFKLYQMLSGRLGNYFGIYEGRKLSEFLREKILEKIPDDHPITQRWKNKSPVSFEELREFGFAELRLIASDVTNKLPVVFPHDVRRYGCDVVTAVRASSGYPFAFQPVNANDCLLVDGGLASNLPSFLFADRYLETRIPTIAFDLINRDDSQVNNILTWAKQNLYTSLEASDHLLRDQSSGVIHVPIEVPPDIDTLDFNISPVDLKRLYDTGYAETSRYLLNLDSLKALRSVAETLQEQLKVQYGDPKIYQPVLQAIKRDVEELTNAQNVRVQVMLSTGRPGSTSQTRTRMIVYSEGMSGDNDYNLEIDEDAGCTGKSWETKKVTVADLDKARENPEQWKMTTEKHQLVPSRVKSMLSVPIPIATMTYREFVKSEIAPIGTLSIDSETNLSDTLWVNDDTTIDAAFVSVMNAWATVIARLIP